MVGQRNLNNTIPFLLYEYGTLIFSLLDLVLKPRDFNGFMSRTSIENLQSETTVYNKVYLEVNMYCAQALCNSYIPFKILVLAYLFSTQKYVIVYLTWS